MATDKTVCRQTSASDVGWEVGILQGYLMYQWSNVQQEDQLTYLVQLHNSKLYSQLSKQILHLQPKHHTVMQIVNWYLSIKTIT